MEGVQTILTKGKVRKRIRPVKSGKDAIISIKIRDYLNKKFKEYHFELIDSFVYIADRKNKMFIETKADYSYFDTAKILRATGEERINNSKHPGVTDDKIVKLCTPTPLERILSLVKNFNPHPAFSSNMVDLDVDPLKNGNKNTRMIEIKEV